MKLLAFKGKSDHLQKWNFMLEQKSAWLPFLWTRNKLGLAGVKKLWAITDMQEGKTNSAKYQIRLQIVCVFAQTLLPKDISINLKWPALRGAKMVLFQALSLPNGLAFSAICVICTLRSWYLNLKLHHSFYRGHEAKMFFHILKPFCQIAHCLLTSESNWKYESLELKFMVWIKTPWAMALLVLLACLLILFFFFFFFSLMAKLLLGSF